MAYPQQPAPQQPVPQQPAPQQPVPRQPAARGGTARRIVIIVAVVVVLCCGGVVGGGYALFRTVWNATGPVRGTVNTFLDHLRDGETDAAYGQLCTGTRERYDADRFRALVTDRPRPTSHSITGISLNTTNGRSTGAVRTRIRYADGSSGGHEFPLVKEGGAWRICGDPY